MEPFLQNALIVTVGTLLGVPLALLTLLRRDDERLLDLGLGFTGGIMLVASFTSLILPAWRGSGRWGWASWAELRLSGYSTSLRRMNTSYAATRGLRSWRIR